MKKILTSILGFIFLLSCNKSDTAESNFSWTYNGSTYIAKQYSAYASGIGAPSIRAGLQTNIAAPGSGPRINLTSLQQGTYAFTSGTGNRFDYVDEAGNIHAGSAGSLNIVKNANNFLDGNFSVTLTNNKTITGEITNTPIKP